MSEFFFEGKDLRVRPKLFPNSPRLVITFTGRAAKPPVAYGFGERFLEKRGISAIHFISTWNHWWQTPEVMEAIGRLREAGLLDPGVPIVLYGSSMGGYAVLRYSRELRAESILAVSPQYSIDAKVVPFEKRWRDYASKLTFNWDDMPAALAHEPRLMVVVDPLFVPDWKHVELVQRLRPVEVLATTFAGHNTARALEEIGVVSTAMEKGLLGQLDRVQYVREYRQRRRYSCLVWLGLAEKLLERGRPGNATLAATMAAALLSLGAGMGDRPLRVDILDMALQHACQDGYEPLAREWLKALVEFAPETAAAKRAPAWVALAFGAPADLLAAETSLAQQADVDSVLLRSRLLARLKRADAHTVLEALPPRVQRSAPVQCALAALLLDEGDAKAAEEATRLALKADPSLWQARVVQARALVAAGSNASARNAIQPLLKLTITSTEHAELIAGLVQTLAGKAEATAFRGRTRRARWLQELLLQQLERRPQKDLEGWVDQGLRTLADKLAARRRRLEEAGAAASGA